MRRKKNKRLRNNRREEREAQNQDNRARRRQQGSEDDSVDSFEGREALNANNSEENRSDNSGQFNINQIESAESQSSEEDDMDEPERPISNIKAQRRQLGVKRQPEKRKSPDQLKKKKEAEINSNSFEASEEQEIKEMRESILKYQNNKRKLPKPNYNPKINSSAITNKKNNDERNRYQEDNKIEKSEKLGGLRSKPMNPKESDSDDWDLDDKDSSPRDRRVNNQRNQPKIKERRNYKEDNSFDDEDSDSFEF